MAKVISLSDKAYEVLKKMKKEGDSFSDVVLRLSKKSHKTSLSAFAGKWAGNDIETIFEQVIGDRETARSRTVNL